MVYHFALCNSQLYAKALLFSPRQMNIRYIQLHYILQIIRDIIFFKFSQECIHIDRRLKRLSKIQGKLAIPCAVLAIWPTVSLVAVSGNTPFVEVRPFEGRRP